MNSFLVELKKLKGKAGLLELERRLRIPVKKLKSRSNMSPAEQLKVIHVILDIIYGSMPAKYKAFEAGRWQCRNFLRSPLARLTYIRSRFGFKSALLKPGRLALRVFTGLPLSIVDVGRRTVKIIMNERQYPPEYFQGFLQEWIKTLRCFGTVSFELTGGGVEYLIDWHEAG